MELNEKSFERLSSEEKHSDEIVRPAISYWADAWRRLKKNPIAMISLVILISAILLAICISSPFRCLSEKSAVCSFGQFFMRSIAQNSYSSHTCEL